jgi:beta-lactamase regulating signal transducer with metallopeptidase domain
MTLSVLLWLGAHLFLHNLWIFLTVLLTKGLVLFGLAYATTRLIPSLPAEYKHSIWLVMVLGFVLLPAGRLFVAVVPVAVPDANEAGSVYNLVAAPVAYSERVISIIDATKTIASGGATEAVRRLLLLLPVSLWLVGVAFFILRYFGGRVALRRLSLARAVSPHGRLPLGELVNTMTIQRKISLFFSDQCAIPMTYGLLRSMIVLPAVSRTWPEERLRAVLIHELTHVKRADSLSNAVVYLVCALLWFNPFAWLARAFMLGEAEISCDRSVLKYGMQGTEYASAIVETVRAARGHFLVPGAHGLLGRKRLLEERILRVLKFRSGDESMSLARTGRALLFLFSLLLPLFAVTYSLKTSEKFYGTWVDKGVAGYYKLSWNADGIGQQFDKTLPDDPCNEGQFVVEKKWSDPQGNTWYNVRAEWSSLPVPWFALIRVEGSGDVLELDASYSGFPRQFSGPVGAGLHQLYARQGQTPALQARTSGHT